MSAREPRPRAHLLDPRAHLAVPLGLLVSIVVPATAHAANGATPRIPPVFKLEQCLTVVDRRDDPVFQLDYAIALESTTITDDELSDSKTFQFFALCRDHSPAEFLPNWIVRDDADRALQKHIIDESLYPDDDEVLALAPAWRTGHDGGDTCVHPIVDVADRIPMTCEATAGGVAWDTTDVPAGNYVIRGYTFEPAANLWQVRRGVVQVTDGDVAPVAALMAPLYDANVYADRGLRLRGCMGGPEGTVVELAWARIFDLEVDEPDDWRPILDDAGEPVVLPASACEIDVHFVPPDEAVNHAVVFRAVARAPDGRAWTGYAPGMAIVLAGDGTGDETEPGETPDACGAYEASQTEALGCEPADPDDGGGTPGEAHPDAGCRCAAREAAPGGWLAAVVLVALRRRRRSRPPSDPTAAHESLHSRPS